ncbi:hypothetical protein DRO69_14605 [Candidatus Bathyarchaeota archaeon]|nr:MAG: hypothetical protein DRO69_14605 [Candidatus Bathyarchaeota archaeon]
MPSEKGENLDVKIIEYLLRNSRKTAPQIAKAIGTPTSTIEYRLKNLVEKGILLVETPKSSAIRKYGRKYYINPNVKPNPRKTMFLILFTVGLALSGLVLIPTAPLASSILLLPSSVLGVMYAVQKYILEIRNQARLILNSA